MKLFLLANMTYWIYRSYSIDCKGKFELKIIPVLMAICFAATGFGYAN